MYSSARISPGVSATRASNWVKSVAAARRSLELRGDGYVIAERYRGGDWIAGEFGLMRRAAQTVMATLSTQTGESCFLAIAAQDWQVQYVEKAISDNPLEPVIDLECVSWARGIVGFCTETMMQDAERFVADNETEANHKRVLEAIRKGGADGVSHSALLRACRFLKSRDLKEILSALNEDGSIASAAAQTSGRPVIIHKIL